MPEETTQNPAKQAPAEMLQKAMVYVILQTQAQYRHLLFAPQGAIYSSLYVHLQAKGLGD